MNPVINAEFRTHQLNEQGIEKAGAIGSAFDDLLEYLKKQIPEGRGLAIVKTKLEEASFFAKKAMACDPINQTQPGQKAA